MQTTTKISLELLKSALRCNFFEDTRSSSQGIGRIGHQIMCTTIYLFVHTSKDNKVRLYASDVYSEN
jgi:hypothetical protein